MATFHAVYDAVRVAVEAISTWQETKTPLGAGMMPATEAVGTVPFFIDVAAGESTISPAGGDVGMVEQDLIVEFISPLDAAYTTSMGTALDRISTLIGTLDQHDALGSVDAHADYQDHSIERTDRYLIVQVGFTVRHTLTYT